MTNYDFRPSPTRMVNVRRTTWGYRATVYATTPAGRRLGGVRFTAWRPTQQWAAAWGRSASTWRLPSERRPYRP